MGLSGDVVQALLADQNYLAYATNQQKNLFARRHALYSRKAYPTAGQVKLTFFDQGIAAATNKEADTNLLGQGSRLGGSEMFVILSVRVEIFPAQADFYTAAAGTPVAFGEWVKAFHTNSPYLNLTINRTKVIDTVGPLSLFAPGYGPGTVIAGNATVTKNVQFPQFGSPDTTSIWTVTPFITILPDQNILGEMVWQDATSSQLTTAGRTGIMLGGLLIGPGA
jgi:hypothetical protein